MKELRNIPVVLVFLAFSMLLVPSGLAGIISFNPSSVSLYADGNDSIIVRIDELPEGLAWHSFTAKVSDPAVAEISQVSFPEWALVNNATAVPSDSVELRGEDTGDHVVPGATGVILGTIHIRAKDPGSATISIEGIRIEDDAGVILEPVSHSASVAVTGREGDSSGSGVLSSEDSGTASVITERTASPTDLTGARQAGSGDEFSSGSTSQEASVVPLAPAASTGILPLPLLWIVVIVIMVGAAASVLYLAVKQKI